MPNRTRLPRGEVKKTDERLKRQVIAQLKGLPTDRVKKYALLPPKSVAGNEVLALTKIEAQKELINRQQQLVAWKKGVAPKEPVLPKVAKGIHKAIEFAGKGVQEYIKIISGEKARELEETIATLGMTPEEKEKELKRLRTEQVAEAKAMPTYEPVEPTPLKPAEDLSLDKSLSDISAELRKSKKEAGL